MKIMKIFDHENFELYGIIKITTDDKAGEMPNNRLKQITERLSSYYRKFTTWAMIDASNKQTGNTDPKVLLKGSRWKM